METRAQLGSEGWIPSAFLLLGRLANLYKVRPDARKAEGPSQIRILAISVSICVRCEFRIPLQSSLPSKRGV